MAIGLSPWRSQEKRGKRIDFHATTSKENRRSLYDHPKKKSGYTINSRRRLAMHGDSC
jgi:hypothetical protein